MNDERIIRTLRAQAWARAKGELGALLQTYWNDDKFHKIYEEIERFVNLIDDNGWAE